METGGLFLRSVSAARGERETFERFLETPCEYSARHRVQQRYYKHLLHVLLHVSGLVELPSPAKGRETARLYQPAKMEEPPRDPFLNKATPYAVHAVLPVASLA